MSEMATSSAAQPEIVDSFDMESYLGNMDGGELLFLAGGALAVLMLLKTCFQMCSAIANPTPDEEPAPIPGAPAPSAKLLSDDIESGRRPESKPKGGKMKLTHAKPAAGRKPKHEPLQPLVKSGTREPASP